MWRDALTGIDHRSATGSIGAWSCYRRRCSCCAEDLLHAPALKREPKRAASRKAVSQMARCGGAR